ncbi:MAG: hypothetical protein GY778_05350 [bacterium]|nr:hypothetical protein [bacterium]
MSHDEWWPNVILPNQQRAISLLGPVADTEDSAPITTGKVTLPDVRFAPADACAVLVYGVDVPGGRRDTELMRDFLVNSGRVNSENILLNTQSFGGGEINRVASRGDLQQLLVTAAGKNCKKLYLLISAHGSRGGGGGVGLRPPPGADPSVTSDNLKYEDLTTMLSGLDGVEYCAVISACFSGNASRWFDGRGFNGVLITDADTTHSSFGSNRFGSTYLFYFLRASNQSAAAADGDGTITFEEAPNHATSTNTDVQNLVSPNPGAHVITSDGPKNMDVSDVDISSDGHPQWLEVTRPLSSNFDSPFTATITVADPSIASVDQSSIEIPAVPGGDPTAGKKPNSVKFRFQGLQCGTTSYTITGTDNSGMTWMSGGTIQVGAFTLSQREIDVDLAQGQTVPVAVTVTRFRDVNRLAVFKLWTRNPSVAQPVPTEFVMAPGQPTMTFVVQVNGVGTTTIDVENRTDFRTKSIRVNVTGSGGEPDSGCAVSGEADTSFTIPDGGNPGNHPLDFKTGTVFFSRLSLGRMQIWGNRPEVVNAEVTIDEECNFEGTGNSGEVSIAGFNNVAAQYSGSFLDKSTRLSFRYSLGTNSVFPGGQAVQYDAEGTVVTEGNGGGGGGSPQNQTFTFNGGFGNIQVNPTDSQQWITLPNVGWIFVLSGQSGSGPGTVQFQVLPNLSFEPRTGTISVAGQTFTIEQGPAPNPFAPELLSASNGATFQEGFSSQSWISLTGNQLAPTTKVWFTDGKQTGRRAMEADDLPTELAGVRVRINGLPAAISFVSPTQINVLWPDDPIFGDVEIEIINAQGVSNTLVVNKQDFAPAMFRFNAESLRYVAGVHPDGVFLGKAGLIPGAATRPVRPGDVILVFGTGFGPTDPPTPSGKLVTQAAALAFPLVARIGGANAAVRFAGIVGAGLYQFNLVVPELEDGDHLLEMFVNGIGLQDTVYITAQQ